LNTTGNLGLKKPELTDTVDIQNFNDNADAIDGKFGAAGHTHDGTAGNGPKIGSAGLADGAVGTAALAAKGVTQAKIGDKVVAAAQLADGAATDTVIGSRTISDATAPTGDTGTPTTLFGWLANMIKQITGKTSWRTAPATNLEAVNTHINAGTAHGSAAAATANAIVQRDASGRAKVAAPSAVDDIARLDTVTGKVGDLTTLSTTAKTSAVAAINELFQNASDGKTSVAAAITGMGQAATGADTFAQLATKVGQISSDANAAVGDVLSGKTFYQGGGKKTGTIPVNGYTSVGASDGSDANSIVSGSASNAQVGRLDFNIPAGYYIGAMGLHIKDLLPAYIRSDVKVGGANGIQGTMPVITAGSDPAQGVGLWPDGSLAVYPSAGYRKGGPGAGEIKVSPAQLQSADGDLAPGNIRSDKNIFGIQGSIPVFSSGARDTAEITSWGGTLMARPAGAGGAGSMLYEGDSWIRMTDPDFIASNIRSGVNIFGIDGSLTPGKKYASGNYTIPTSGADTNYLNITGLGWIPSLIFWVFSGGGGIGLYSALSGNQDYLYYFWWSNGQTNYNAISFYPISASQIRLYIGYPGYALTWYVYE